MDEEDNYDEVENEKNNDINDINDNNISIDINKNINIVKKINENNKQESIITLSVDSQEKDNENTKNEEKNEKLKIEKYNNGKEKENIIEKNQEKINYLFSLSKSDLLSNEENNNWKNIFFYNSKDKIVKKKS